MSGQSIALATKGVICKGGSGTVIINKRCVLPFNLQLKNDPLQSRINLESKELNINLDTPKLRLQPLMTLKINANVTTLKQITVKKCEE